MERGGGEKRGRAWAAGGRGLQPPRAAAAAAQPALSLHVSLRLPARCAPGPVLEPRGALLFGPPPRTRRDQAAPGGRAAPSGGSFGGRSRLSLAGGPAGKEGESGYTHTGRGARALHTRSRAPPQRRVRGEFGPAARARHLPAPRAAPRPGPRPADPPAPRLRSSPCARGKRLRPGNLQSVAQLVSTPEAP